MKKIFDNPFTKLLPHLDLHGETTETSPFLINSFIKDNYIMGKNKIVIIHGRHSNILKNTTHEILKKSKYVKSFEIDSLNNGQTIVDLVKKD